MKRNTGLLLVALLAALTLLVSGCGEKQETPDGAPDEPLMQEEDLTIEPQPDANFTLELPDGFLSLGADYEPNGKTENTTYDSDGMLPYDFARHYDADAHSSSGRITTLKRGARSSAICALALWAWERRAASRSATARKRC